MNSNETVTTANEVTQSRESEATASAHGRQAVTSTNVSTRPAVIAMAISALVAGAFLIIGLYLGNSSVTAGGVDCGSAFSPDSSTASVDDYVDSMLGETSLTSGAACDDATADRHTTAIVMLIVGGMAAVGVGASMVWESRLREQRNLASGTTT